MKNRFSATIKEQIKEFLSSKKWIPIDEAIKEVEKIYPE